MSSNTETRFVIVARNRDFGFWELDLLNKRAYLREKTYIIPSNFAILDYEKEFDTITDFLKQITKVKYVKTMIPDRKVIWGDAPFCSWFSKTADKDDPDTVLYCNRPALLEINGRIYCGEHAEKRR